MNLNKNNPNPIDINPLKDPETKLDDPNLLETRSTSGTKAFWIRNQYLKNRIIKSDDKNNGNREEEPKLKKKKRSIFRNTPFWSIDSRMFS